MFFLGIEIDREQVRASLIEAVTAKQIATGSSVRNKNLLDTDVAVFNDLVLKDILSSCAAAVMELLYASGVAPTQVNAIGISYPNEGMVLLNHHNEVIYHTEIDTAGFSIHTSSFPTTAIAEQYFGEHLMNLPDNSQMGRLTQLYKHHPALLGQAQKMVLPGDYICYVLTGQLHTTIADISYAVCWDFKSGEIAKTLIRHFGFESTLLPEVKQSCAIHGHLVPAIASAWGVPEGIPITYRAGAYLNHALSLQVLRPFEIAINIGEKGGFYSVKSKSGLDNTGRIISLAHINHCEDNPVYGQVMQIDSKKETAISNSPDEMSAEYYFDTVSMNRQTVMHQQLYFKKYKEGWQLLKKKGLIPSVLRARQQYLFQQNSFCQMVADELQVTLEIFATNAAQSAALAAGVGFGYYPHHRASFSKIRPTAVYLPTGWTSLNEEPELKQKGKRANYVG